LHQLIPSTYESIPSLSSCQAYLAPVEHNKLSVNSSTYNILMSTNIIMPHCSAIAQVTYSYRSSSMSVLMIGHSVHLLVMTVEFSTNGWLDQYAVWVMQKWLKWSMTVLCKLCIRWACTTTPPDKCLNDYVWQLWVGLPPGLVTQHVLKFLWANLLLL